MKRYLLAFAVFVLLIFGKENVWAYGTSTEDMMGDMDFSEISSFLDEKEEIGQKITFEEILQALLGKGDDLQYEKIGEYIKEILLEGFRENKTLLLQLLAVSLAFSILKTFAKSFSNSYVSETCFVMFYCFMMILLLRSFSELNTTMLKTTEDMVSFMKLFIPTYCMAISFTLNLNSSAAVYSMIFAVIYIVEWLIRYFLVPLVQIYVIIEFLNYLVEEERFKRLSELLCDTVKMILKASVSVILGINIIQGMVAPAMDRLSGNTIAKTVQMLPGIGNVMSGTGQIFISSGLVIKNCVGAAALIVLVILCAVPFIKMACVAILYRILAAVLEPIGEKRISGGINGIANGGMLYLKIMITCLMLFFLTIALSSAATNLNVGG